MREPTGEGKSFGDPFAGAVRIAEEPEIPSSVGQAGNAGVLPVGIRLSRVALRIVDGRTLL